MLKTRTFQVIWTNWYGRKQVRLFEIDAHCYRRKDESNEVRAEHPYVAIEKIDVSKEESGTQLKITLKDGAIEYYSSGIPGVIETISKLLEEKLK